MPADEELTPLYHEAAQQAVNAFNTRWAQVSWVDASRVFVPGGLLFPQIEGQEPVSVMREQSVCVLMHLRRGRLSLVIWRVIRALRPTQTCRN